MKIELQNVSKIFGRHPNTNVAVDDVSWCAEGGEVFGLLGPNGAGKTTMIRMMLDIIRPDQGHICVDGAPKGNRRDGFKQRVGYLPEERGLYRKRKVIDVLTYLGALKGLPSRQARRQGMSLLERFELAEWSNKKIEDLSKGMSQKVQIISCLLHDPDLVVLDEPFSGLDPINVRSVRKLIAELKARGKLVFLSTHMMGEVEALCDRIFMIHEGRQVLYGALREIRKSFTEHEVLLDAESQPESLPCADRITITAAGKCVHLKPGKTIHDLMAEMAAHRRPVKRFEEALAPIEDIFVSLIQKQEGEDA